MLANLPWYVKLALSLGLAGVIWRAVQAGIPRLFAKLLPIVIRAVDWFCDWMLSHQTVKKAVVEHKEPAIAFVNALMDGILGIIKAAGEEVDKKINEAKE